MKIHSKKIYFFHWKRVTKASFCGVVAQSVEQQPFKLVVLGSIPSYPKLNVCWDFFYYFLFWQWRRLMRSLFVFDVENWLERPQRHVEIIALIVLSLFMLIEIYHEIGIQIAIEWCILLLMRWRMVNIEFYSLVLSVESNIGIRELMMIIF